MSLSLLFLSSLLSLSLLLSLTFLFCCFLYRRRYSRLRCCFCFRCRRCCRPCRCYCCCSSRLLLSLLQTVVLSTLLVTLDVTQIPIDCRFATSVVLKFVRVALADSSTRRQPFVLSGRCRTLSLWRSMRLIVIYSMRRFPPVFSTPLLSFLEDSDMAVVGWT